GGSSWSGIGSTWTAEGWCRTSSSAPRTDRPRQATSCCWAKHGSSRRLTEPGKLPFCDITKTEPISTVRCCYLSIMAAPMTELTTDESVEFLRAQGFGRLAMILSDEPHIVPVNYVHHAADAGPGIVYIRSAPGDKLFAAATNQSVAFQVDRVTDAAAVSVLVRGSARIVEARDEIALVDEVLLEPWVMLCK